MVKLNFPPNKTIGVLTVIVAAVSFLSLLTVSLRIAEASHSICLAAKTGCSVLGHIPLESFFGLGGLIILGGIGVYITLINEPVTKTTVKVTKKYRELAKSLSGDEKKVFEEINNSNGFIFQNDLIDKTGFSKVKVSRILDRLEAKDMIERRRRGMSNIVVLK